MAAAGSSSSSSLRMAPGHDGGKTSVYIDGVGYNVDKVPQELLDKDPELKVYLEFRAFMSYPKKEIAEYQAKKQEEELKSPELGGDE